MSVQMWSFETQVFEELNEEIEGSEKEGSTTDFFSSANFVLDLATEKGLYEGRLKEIKETLRSDPYSEIHSPPPRIA